jgi:hypothetical protein
MSKRTSKPIFSTAQLFIMGVLLWILADVAGVYHGAANTERLHILYTCAGTVFLMMGYWRISKLAFWIGILAGLGVWIWGAPWA